jgi:hypothetical protein
MKKLRLILVMLLAFTVMIPAHIQAFSAGDAIGDVLNTDVRTYINGERIPCYNINNKSVVLAADLKNYGFDVVYNDELRVSAVTRAYEKKFAPLKNIADNTEKAGTVAFSYLYTDISAVVNGKKVESFNIKGNLAIYFSSLDDYGVFTWDEEARSSKLNLYKLDGANTVYITDTGDKYHKDGCRYLRQSRMITAKETAVKMGYIACGVCNP